LKPLKHLLAISLAAFTAISAVSITSAQILTAGTAVSGRVTLIPTLDGYTHQGGTLITGAVQYATTYMPSAKYFAIQGTVINGQWDFTIKTSTVLQQAPTIMEIGINNTNHTQLVAIGVPNASSPGWMRSQKTNKAPTITNRSVHSRSSAPRFTPQLIQCYNNYAQHQKQTTWYEYYPGGYGANKQMAQQIFTMTYHYNDAHNDVNCPVWKTEHASDGNMPIITESSLCTLVHNPPEAITCDSNASWQGNDINLHCVDVDINSMSINGGFDGSVVSQGVNTHAFNCGTGNQMTDWFYTSPPAS
jgi:hypothetical protein